MAAQWITIAKLAGSIGEHVLERFTRWDAARVPDGDDAGLVESVQWPHDARVEADEFVARLADHAVRPPVLFYCRYVDLWSMGDVYSGVLGDDRLQILTDTRELICVDLSVTTPLLARIDDKLERNDLHQETRWFTLLLREAVDAWRNIADRGVLLVIREAFGGLVEDHEVEESLTVMPDWL